MGSFDDPFPVGSPDGIQVGSTTHQEVPTRAVREKEAEGFLELGPVGRPATTIANSPSRCM